MITIKELLKTKKCQGLSEWYEFTNSEGSRIVVEVTHCSSSLICKHDLAYHWAKNGLIKVGPDEINFNYLCVQTFCTFKNGLCLEYANPQTIKHKNQINFKWLLRDTESNKIKLLKKVLENYQKPTPAYIVKRFGLNVGGLQNA